MRQPAINNIFAPTKHYSQISEHECIVLKDNGLDKDDPSKDAQQVSSQKTATSTKCNKGSSVIKVLSNEKSLAAADTLSINSNTVGAMTVKAPVRQAKRSKRL